MKVGAVSWFGWTKMNGYEPGVRRYGQVHRDNERMSEELPLNRPKSKTDLFVSFTLLALQGFGFGRQVGGEAGLEFGVGGHGVG